MVMRTRIPVVVSLALLVGCGDAPPPEPVDEAPSLEERAQQFDDSDVARIWTRMMETISPDDGWERARYLEFHWAVTRDDDEPLVREHRWDRWEGRARMEAPTDDGRMVALFDTDDPEAGRVWMDGEELEGEEARERLASAHRGHINDSYWLVMPFKWDDPGVHLRYGGHMTDDDGMEWEVVDLTFEDQAGYTPQNMYRAFINPESGRMERWHFFSNPDATPSPADWTEWQRVGPIELAENRRVDGEPRIFFPHLRVETDVPDDAFAPPGG